jgi:hypothetical protein
MMKICRKYGVLSSAFNLFYYGQNSIQRKEG